MTYYSGPAHCATALVEAAAERAFDFLADPVQLGTWSLGCLNVTQKNDGLATGTSIYDDSPALFRIQADRTLLLVDYWVGPADRLVPRISARVITSETCDLEPNQCYVSLMAWRSTQMSDLKWRQLCSAHEAEIWIVKARIEGIAPR